VNVICLDLEGVLVPEIWISVADKTGIEGLRLTTRDIADYDELMQHRLQITREHKLTLADIQRVIESIDPLAGAKEFVDWAKSEHQLIILSDTFSQFARPLMRKLDWPTLFCHRIETDDNGVLNGYTLRQPDQKRQAVTALRSLNLTVVAAGDSYNDTSMLAAAHRGFLFRPPESVHTEFPQYTVLEDHSAMRVAISDAFVALAAHTHST
jgi:phosphoserine/homoserine phosphotransferase